MATSEQKARLAGVTILFSKSYGLVRENIGVYKWVYAIPALLAVADVAQMIANNEENDWSWSSSLGYSVGGNTDVNIPTTGIVIYLILIAAAGIVTLLANVLNLRAAQNQKPDFRSVWHEFTKDWLWLRLIGLSILSTILIFVGLILLVIPGLIVIARLFLAPYVMIDQKLGVVDSIKKSWHMFRGYFGAVWVVILFGIVLSLSGIIPVVGSLIAFVLGVAYAVAPALRYQEVKKQS